MVIKMVTIQNDIPFQVESLIKQMLDKNEKLHVRTNFRNRLDSIRDALNASIKEFDNELFISNIQKVGPKKRN